VIVIDHAAKTFVTRGGEAVVALSGISLTIARNEFVCLVGPSGCGKSTLLRLVAGLVTPSSGTVAVGGTAVTAPREDTGIVFQAPTLLPWASILDNVLFPLDMMGKLDAAGRARARDLLALVGLSGFEGKYPRELSGGMQQRAGICRALVHDPDILLMDEPFAALDEITRFRLNDDLLTLWRSLGKTVIFVTHSVFESVYLSQRVVVMTQRPGRIGAEIRIEAGEPRSDGFRTSAVYADYCRKVSCALAPSYAGRMAL